MNFPTLQKVFCYSSVSCLPTIWWVTSIFQSV